MLALPLWVRLSRHAHPLRLLIFGQLMAGLLALACAAIEQQWLFWPVSLTMIAFKASYLLMYPYVMGLVGADQQVRTIGLLSVVVHLGAIAGATLGGGVLHYLSPARMFVLMGLMDFVQMAVSLLLLRHAPQPTRVDASTPPRPRGEHLAIARLCLLMLAFYFCIYLARPFFTVYWEQLGGPQASWITGLVYAIPGMLALLALALHYHAGQHLTAWLLLGAAGLALQGIEQMPLVLAGRVLFGWALYQLTVALDARLFALSRPEHYGRDYSLINIFQNLGVLAASWLAGLVVRDAGLAAPFFLSALGLVLTACVLRWLLVSAATRAPLCGAKS
jgi:predicted MFS family arabinose efflux permease